jgi:hypothetical protein
MKFKNDESRTNLSAGRMSALCASIAVVYVGAAGGCRCSSRLLSVQRAD